MIEKVRCEFPQCKKEGIYRHVFQVINEENASVDLPFCEYHYYIVMGGHFKAKIHKIKPIPPTKKEPKGTPGRTEFELVGPLKEIEIAEQVIGAREMVKLKNDNKKGK